MELMCYTFVMFIWYGRNKTKNRRKWWS